MELSKANRAEQDPDVFAAIASGPRRELLEKLAEKESAVTELAASFQMTLSAVSQHLAVLKAAGLVEDVKVGKQRIYRLCPQPLQQVSRWVARYDPFWRNRLIELEKILEENR